MEDVAKLKAMQAPSLLSGAGGQLGAYYPRYPAASLVMDYMDGDIHHSVRVNVPNEAVGHILVAVQEEVAKANAIGRKAQEALASQAMAQAIRTPQ